MFSLFRRKQQEPNGIPRGILPTYVTSEVVILCKAANHLYNTYEIRLTLYMAVSKGLRFVLGLKPEASLEPSLSALLDQHGGQIERGNPESYSVYFGCLFQDGKEEGWVLGNEKDLIRLRNAVESPWLQERIAVGTSFRFSELSSLEGVVNRESIEISNIDGENVKEAFLNLISIARQKNGEVFIQ